MRERKHGQDSKEKSEAGSQGEAEDCCEAFGQRPSQDDGEARDCEALDRQVEGSSPARRLTADVDTDVHNRPGDLARSPADPFLESTDIAKRGMRADCANRDGARATPDCAKWRFHHAISPRISRRIVHSKIQNRTQTA